MQTKLKSEWMQKYNGKILIKEWERMKYVVCFKLFIWIWFKHDDLKKIMAF